MSKIKRRVRRTRERSHALAVATPRQQRAMLEGTTAAQQEALEVIRGMSHSFNTLVKSGMLRTKSKTLKPHVQRLTRGLAHLSTLWDKAREERAKFERACRKRMLQIQRERTMVSVTSVPSRDGIPRAQRGVFAFTPFPRHRVAHVSAMKHK